MTHNTIEVKEVRVAYIKGKISESLKDELCSEDATMYNNEGGGQYELVSLQKRFDEESNEYIALGRLIDEGYDYLEYS